MKYFHLGPSPPRRDDPMISGPLSSLPPDLESRLNAARNKSVSSALTSSSSSSQPGDSGNGSSQNSGSAIGHSPRPRKRWNKDPYEMIPLRQIQNIFDHLTYLLQYRDFQGIHVCGILFFIFYYWYYFQK